MSKHLCIKKYTLAALLFSYFEISVAMPPPIDQIPASFPRLVLYGIKGVGDHSCTINLTTGHHVLKRAGCPNDDAYFFVIEHPRENVDFDIYREFEDDNDQCHGKYARYLVRDPIPNQDTRLLTVDAAKGLAPYTEISPGVLALGYGVWGGGPDKHLPGEVSCITVHSSGG